MIYPNIRKEIFRATIQALFDGGIKNSPFDFWPREVILMNGIIIGVKIDLSLVHVLARKNLFEHRHQIPQHLALPGLPTHVHQKDIGLLWRDLVVNSK
jgi:hypothetical protein